MTSWEARHRACGGTGHGRRHGGRIRPGYSTGKGIHPIGGPCVSLSKGKRSAGRRAARLGPALGCAAALRYEREAELGHYEKEAKRASVELKEEQALQEKKGRPTGPKGREDGKFGFSFSNFSKANSKCKFKSI